MLSGHGTQSGFATRNGRNTTHPCSASPFGVHVLKELLRVFGMCPATTEIINIRKILQQIQNKCIIQKWRKIQKIRGFAEIQKSQKTIPNKLNNVLNMDQKCVKSASKVCNSVSKVRFLILGPRKTLDVFESFRLTPVSSGSDVTT